MKITKELLEARQMDDYDKAQVKAYNLLKKKNYYAVIYAYVLGKYRHILDPVIPRNSKEEVQNFIKTFSDKYGGTQVTVDVFYQSQLDSIHDALKDNGLIKEALDKEDQENIDKGIIGTDTVTMNKRNSLEEETKPNGPIRYSLNTKKNAGEDTPQASGERREYRNDEYYGFTDEIKAAIEQLSTTKALAEIKKVIGKNANKFVRPILSIRIEGEEYSPEKWKDWKLDKEYKISEVYYSMGKKSYGGGHHPGKIMITLVKRKKNENIMDNLEEENKETTMITKMKCIDEDKPAATSIEDCQKWVDYDMKHYGKISDNTNDIIKKAGFQIIKDDHGDYEVTAGKFESVEKDDIPSKMNISEALKYLRNTK